MNLRLLTGFLATICILTGSYADAQKVQDQERLIEEEFIRLKGEQGESHASGAREDLGPVILGNPTQAHTLIRVGLSYSFTSTGAYSEFSTRHHPFAEISHTAGTVYLIDGGSGQEIAELDVPGTIVRVTRDDVSGYHVTVGGVEMGTYVGPLYFEPTDAANLFRIEHIRRTFSGTHVPSYRGTIELSHAGGTSSNRLHVVNIVEIEDYVPGVVANESIASFHLEALKAQATAARGYAIANIGRFRANFPYDIVDSSTSQVYRGVISEHPRAVQSSQETAGLVASYNGQIISALYSSSFGGYSDSNQWIFNSPSNQLPGTNAVPYLQGIYDGDLATPPDLSDPTTRDLFWSTIRPDGYDMCGRVNNRFSRWEIDIPAATIKARLVPGRYEIVSGNITGDITDVQVPLRMTGSNRVAIARVILTTGVAEVRGWDDLRNVFGRTIGSTPATCPNSPNIPANWTLTNPSLITPYTDSEGAFAGVITNGGGWGHNTGMSQYGAHGRGLAGQTFIQILKAYYTGVDIGSYPITIGRDPGSGPPTLRQEFFAANAVGTLEIRNATLKGLSIHINETYDIVLGGKELADGSESVDLSPYLTPGLNVIQYNPVGRHGTATVNVNVE
jgi:peptidoglycan hydrolase-like amidase